MVMNRLCNASWVKRMMCKRSKQTDGFRSHSIAESERGAGEHFGLSDQSEIVLRSSVVETSHPV